MVVQRTIEHLRERPANERRAVALGIAIAVMLVLFIGWGIFFIRQMSAVALAPLESVYSAEEQSASAAASDVTGWFSENTESQVLPEETPPTLGTDRIEVIEQLADQVSQ